MGVGAAIEGGAGVWAAAGASFAAEWREGWSEVDSAVGVWLGGIGTIRASGVGGTATGAYMGGFGVFFCS